MLTRTVASRSAYVMKHAASVIRGTDAGSVVRKTGALLSPADGPSPYTRIATNPGVPGFRRPLSSTRAGLFTERPKRP